MVSKLSGGEKKRLQLMRVLMKNPNFLILDEPTNDLDIDTLNVLEDFLLNFSGVLMLVSHDRYLIDRLTEQLFIFEGGGIVRIYTGNYTDYRFEQEEEKALLKETPKVTTVVKNVVAVPVKKKLSFKESQEIANVEKSISDMESQIKELTEELNAFNIGHKRLLEVSTEIQNLNESLELNSLRWLELSELH